MPMMSQVLAPYNNNCPIVGVGASTEAIEALRRLFENMPHDTGMAFVVVPHLSADIDGMASELLPGHISLPVHQAEDNMAIQPNHIYLTPPRREMTVSSGRLRLCERHGDKAAVFPIDTLFCSMAMDAGPNSVAVVLAGTGNDGSRGIQDVHAAGGLVMVEREDPARLDSLSCKARETGVADLVLPPGKICDALVRYVAPLTVHEQPLPGRSRVAGRHDDDCARRDEFLAMLSHELRNPLGAIINASHLLGDPEKTERARHVIARQSAHMARLLDDLLDTSRISQGKIEIRRTRVDLNDALEFAVEMVQPMIQSRGLNLRVSRPDSPVVVRGDRDRLEQVIYNLLRNAAQFTDPGGDISLHLRAAGNRVEIVVRDSGIGLTPEDQERVFDLFYQHDMGLDRAGSGLGVGLSLVRDLVGLHGGSVAARSEGRGKGSEFTVFLPAAPSKARARSPRNVDGGQEQQGLTIVIVEDNEDSREMLELLLSARGHTVLTAADGAAGAQLIIERRPDLALIDIGLPVMDGYEVARTVRRECGSDMSTYLIALTGYGRQEHRQAVREAGFDEHLVKPIDIASLDQLAGCTKPR